MASAFNLLTAGGARFDKTRFKHDHDLFSKAKPEQKPRASSSKKSKSAAASTEPSSLKSGVLPAGPNLFSDPSSSTSAGRAKASASAEVKEESSSEPDTESEDDLPSPPVQKITLSGPDPLPTSLASALDSLITHPSHPLPSSSGQPLLRALSSAGIRSLWGVQAAVGGCILEGQDVLCVAPTGSGKTLAYVLPTLVALRDPAKRGKQAGGIRAVILVPTHDLGVQILGVAKAVTSGRSWRVLMLSKATERAVCESSPGEKWAAGGSKGKASAAQSGNAIAEEEEEDGAADEDEDVEDDDGAAGEQDQAGSSGLALDILIATPERLHHLVQNKQISLAKTGHLIMDEADRLLSSDFLPQVEPIIKACPNDVQKCLLSATIPAGAEAVARGWMKDGGVRVVVGVKDSAVSTIAQSLLYTSTETGKLLALRNLLTSGALPYPSLIFVQSIQRADDLLSQILMDPQMEGVRVGVVHGGKTNGARDEAVKAFREGRVWVLVVTEVMARGMDFGGVKVVVNYDFPQTVQSYIHRIGRTGRAGRPGKAITFYNKEDGPYVRTIANVLLASGCPVPEYIMSLPPPSKNLKRHLAQAPVKRKVVGGGGRDLAKEERKRKGEMVRGSMKRRKGDVNVDED